MNNSQISARIKRLAAMMTLLGENQYKVRAFDKAADIIDLHPEEMGVLIDEDRLKAVPGIGDSLAHAILYYAKSGGPSIEKELEARLPSGLPDLLTLKGLGLRKVQTLWKDHQISNLSDLERACNSGELSQWKGFGPKLEQKLLEAIAFKAKHTRDFHLDMATQIATKWREKLSDLSDIDKIELTGQLRRGNELIQSVDFVVIPKTENLHNSLQEKFQLELTGTDPLIITDPSGMPINLWLCSTDDFPARQLILTGGKTYLEKIDTVLTKKNLSIEQDRIVGFQGSETSEVDLCRSLGLQWIEPPLRDSFDCFPKGQGLVQDKDIRGILHAHSTWSDGRNSLEEMVVGAQKLGYQYLGISDHSQAAYYANGLKPDRVKAQWNQIDELNESYPDIHIFKGIEADILSDGSLDYDDELLAGFDFVIASIHSHFHLDSTIQTDRIIRALQSPFTTILGHPTGRMLLAREGYAPDLPAIIEAASEYDKIIEINTTPKRLDLDWRYLKQAKASGVRVSINPDAHSLSGLETIPLGVIIAQKGGLSPEDVINTSGVSAFNSFLQKQKSR